MERECFRETLVDEREGEEEDDVEGEREGVKGGDGEANLSEEGWKKRTPSRNQRKRRR